MKTKLFISISAIFAFLFFGCSGEDGKDDGKAASGEYCEVSADETILKCGEKTVILDNNSTDTDRGLFCELKTVDSRRVLQCGNQQVEIGDGSSCELLPKDKEYTLKCGSMQVDITGEGMVIVPPQQTLKKASVSGISQKGPFVKGSKITAFELDDEFTQTGKSFVGTITSDNGKFELENLNLSSGYVIFTVDGFYLNEVTGTESTAPITLYAISDVSQTNTVNVNILTHLEYYRVSYLLKNTEEIIGEDKSLLTAKKQAQKEIFAVFGIEQAYENSENMDIFNDGALLAISVLMLGNYTDAEFTKILSDLNFALRENGEWNSKDAEVYKASVADWVNNRVNVTNKPTFCYYGINNCHPMPTDDMCAHGQLVNNCDLRPEYKYDSESIKKNILAWGIIGAVPDFEQHINNYWHMNYGLGECNANSDGIIKKNNNEKSLNYNIDYICKNNKWRIATQLEIETYGWDCTEDEIKKGNVSEIDYICKYGTWKIASYKDIKCSEEKNCNYFTDKRDNQRYAYVTIGEGTDAQTWMAENLNFATVNSSSICREDASCNEFGRVYDWSTAMGIDEIFNNELWEGSDVNHKGVCPSGWHLPNNSEWEKLLITVQGSERPGKKLKATSGWTNGTGGNGTDDYGFSALACIVITGMPGNYTCIGGWRSSTQEDNNYTYTWDMSGFHEEVEQVKNGKNGNAYIRCVKD